MILNRNLILSENQAITATAISTNVIQWESVRAAPYESAGILRNLGDGTDIPLLIQITQQFNNLTSLTITLESADNAGLSTNAIVMATSGAIPLASLLLGFRPLMSRIMPHGQMRDFFGVRYTVVGTAPTLGQVTAAIATEVQSA